MSSTSQLRTTSATRSTSTSVRSRSVPPDTSDVSRISARPRNRRFSLEVSPNDEEASAADRHIPTLGAPPSPGRDVVWRWVEELTQLRAWPYVQLRSQQVVVAFELPQRLGAVLLRKVHFDQSSMRGLTQGIHP